MHAVLVNIINIVYIMMYSNQTNNDCNWILKDYYEVFNKLVIVICLFDVLNLVHIHANIFQKERK